MPKPQSTTTYLKSRPLGLRGRRVVAKRGVIRQKTVVAKKSSVAGAPQSARKVYRARTHSFQRAMRHELQTRQHQRVQVTYRTRMVLASLSCLLFFGVALVSRAETEPQTLHIRPQSCTGWDRSDKAQEIQALGNTGLAQFPQDASAQAGGGSGAAQLVCKNFALPSDFHPDASFSQAELVLSLAGKAGQDSEDLVVMESSLDGKTWTRLDSFGLNQDVSNAQHGGYWRAAFPLLHRGNIDTFQVRVRYIALSPDAAATVYVDGIGLDVEQVAKPKREPLFLSGDVVQVEDTQLKNSEDPVLKVEVEKQSRFSFLPFTKTERTVEAKKLVGPDGAEVPAEYDVTRVTEGRSTYERIEVRNEMLHKPGKYTAEITIVQGNKETTVKKDFYWGVLVLNTPKSIYHPGENIDVGMGVLDPQGHTICDAKLWLTITNPSRGVQTFTTDAGSITRSTECGPITVTNTPDYSAVYEGGDEGMYTLDLKAETKFGEYTIQDAIAVRAMVTLDVHRDAPTRIYPVEDYPVTLTVRPQKDVAGFFEDSVPTSFEVSAVSGKGKTVAADNRLTIRWPVQWKGGKIYTLTYRVNPPDIRPELFLLGKARLIKTGSAEPVFEELRHWQIASDAVGSASITRLWSSGFELQTVTANEEFTATVGTAPTIDTSTFRSGVAALQTNESAATSGATFQYSNANATNDYYFRAYVNITNMPETRVNIMEFYDSGPSVQASIRLNSDGTLELWNDEDNAQQTGTSAALSTSTWYRLEFRSDTTTIGTTYLEAKVDGVTFSSGTVNHANGSNVVRIGTLSTDTGGASTIFWDDLAINSDDAGITPSIPENWPGAGKIVHLMPDGQPSGASSNTCSGSTSSWDAVNDRGAGGPDDTTTTVTCDSDAGTDFLEVSLESTGSQGMNAKDRIILTQAGIRYTRLSAAAGAHNLQVKIPSGNAVDQSTSISDSATAYTTNGNAAPRTYKQTSYGDQTSAADYDVMTAANIDDGLLRVTATDAIPDLLVTTMWLLVEYEPAEGGRLWSSGFEMQTVSAGEEWAGIAGGPTINTTATYYRSGGASLRINGMSSGSAEGVNQDFVAANADGPYYARAYLRIETLPSASNRIMSFRDSGTTDRVFLVLTSTGALELHDEDSGGTPIGTSAALSTSTWYRVEFQINSSGAGATDTVEGRINGTNFGSSSTRDLLNGVTTIALGGNLNSEAQTQGDWYFDDVAVNQNAGTTQNGYPGAGSIAHLKPNAAGDNTGFTNDYTYVDEADPDDATTYLYTATANTITDVNLFDSSTQSIGASDTISLVSAGMRANIGNTSAFTTAVRLKDSASGAVIEGTKENFTTTTWMSHHSAIPRIYGMTAYTRPQQLTAWTTTTLDSAQIGVRNLNTSNLLSPEQLQVTTLWLLVEYVPASISIYGKIYTNETPTAYDCSANAITVRASVNGSASEQTADCTLSNGSFAIAAARPSTAADPIAIFIDSVEAIKGTTVTLAADTTSDIVDLHIYQDHTSVRHEDAGPMTNAKLATADTGANVGVRYSVTTGNLTVESGMEFHVWAGDTYDPGGTVTTNSTGGDFHIDDGGTASLDTATNTIGRDILVDGGATLNIDANTIVAGGDITTAGTSAVVTRSTGTATTTMRGSGSIGGGTTPTLTFYNLLIGDGTTATTALSSAATTVTGGDVTVGTGSTFTVGANLTVGGGDFTNTTTGIIASSGTPTVTMRGTGNLGTNGASGAITIYNLVIGDGTAATTTLQKAATVSNNLTVGNGSVASALTVAVGTFTVTGDVVVDTSSTLTVNADMTVNGGAVTGDGTVTTTSGTPTFTLSETGNFGGATGWTFYNLTLEQSGGNIFTTTATGNGGVTVTNVLTLEATAAGESFNMHSLNAGAKTWTLSGSGTPIVDESGFTVLIPGTSTFVYSGTGATTIYVGNFNNLTLQQASGTPTYTLGSSTHIDGNFVMASGLTVDAGTGTVFTTGIGKTITSNGQTLYNLRYDPVSTGTLTLQTGDLTVTNTLLVNTDATLAIASGITLTHTGANVLLTSSSTIAGPGRITFTNTSGGPGTVGIISAITRYDATGGDIASTTFDARTYGNTVEFFNSGATGRTTTFATGMYTLSGASSHFYVYANGTGDMAVTGVTNNPTVNIGGDFDILGTGDGTEPVSSGSGIWTISGNFDATCNSFLATYCYVASTGNTVIMDGTSKTLTAYTGGSTLYNFTSSGSMSIANNLTVSNALLISGSLTPSTFTSTSNLTVGGTFTNNGTFTHNDSRVRLTGSAGSIDGSSSTTFYDLDIGNASGAVTVQTSDIAVTNTLLLSGASNVLTISSGRTITHTGATLTLSGTINGPGRLTYRSATTFPTGGTLGASLILRMDATATDQSMGARTDYQKVEIDNSGTTAGRTVTAGTAGSQTLTIASTLDLLNTGTGSSTTIFQVNTWDPTFTVTGNVTIAADTVFQASSATTTNFGAGFSNAGTFTHNSGTIALTTTAASTIAGSTTFNNLSVTSIGAAKVITVTAATTQTIAGTWTVTGALGQLITLQSSSVGNAWNVNPTSASLSYVDISDANNAGAAICATFSQSTNSGNTNITVSAGATCGIDVAGTSNSSGGTVKVAVNGSIQAQTTTLAGTWTISGVTVATGNTVTVFVDGVADSAETTAVTNYDGSGNITGLVLDTNVLTIGSVDNPSVTVTNMGQYDADDNENIVHTANSSTLAAQAGGTYTSATLSILSGATLTIGGTETVTAKNVTIGGALTSGGNSVYTIAGTLTNNGTFTQSTSTITMTGTSNSLTGSTATTFNNLTINPASTGTITVSTSDLTVSGALDVADGDTLSIGSGRIVNAPGTLTLNTTGTISGDGTLRFTDASSGPGTGGTLSSIVRYDGSSANIASTTLDARTYGGRVELFTNSGTAKTFTFPTGSFTLSGASSHLYVITDGVGDATLIGASNNPTVTVGGDVDFTGTGGGSEVITSGTGVWTVSGNVDFTGGTYTASTDNTLKMNGTSKTLTAAGNELQKFEVSGGSVATADAVLVNKTFDITGGGFTQAANANLTVYGNFTIATGTTFTAATGSGILIMDGNPTPMTFTDNTSPKQDMGNVQVGLSPGTTDLGSDFTAKSVTIPTGDIFNTNGYDLDIGTGGITIVGTLDATDDVETDETFMDTDGKFDLQTGGTFTPDQSTLTMTLASTVVANATTDLITVGTGNPYNVIVNDGGGTYTLTVEVEDPLVVTNNITITGGVLDTKTGESNSISVGNNWTNNDSFTARSATVTFTATDTGNTIGGTMGDLDDFYDLVFNGSGGEWTTNTAMTVGNDLTVTAGSLLGATDITMYGTLAGGGTVTRSGGTFLHRVAAAKNFGSTANANNWTFNNLSFETSGATDRTVTFATGGTGQVIVSGTLTIGNASDSNVTTLDNETNDRILDANGAVTITSKGLLNGSSTASFTVAGNWTNNGDFTDNTGTVTLDGAAQQTVDGQLTGASDRFNNLTITNSSGADPVTSPSVIFAAAAETAATFTAQTANTKLRFLAGGTYTFNNIAFNGQATGTRVFLRSSTTGTLWDLNSLGTQTVSNTDVRDSNACPGDDIDATDGTNYDSTNNPCWNINTLTFSISDTAVGFGTLSSAAARWANGAATGSASAVSAHTLAVTTNARSGYALTYFGSTLSGPEDITAATFTGDADGTPSSEQFALSITTDGNATIPSAYQKASDNYSFVPSTATTLMSEAGSTVIETASVYYICNISSATTAGAYSTNVTYIATTTF
ncbi:MAG: hypothetical protein WC786_00530 [Patescibacteria group bacterium]